MPVTISPAAIEDVRAMAHVLIESYSDDMFFPYLLLPTVSEEDRINFWTEFLCMGFRQEHNYFYKAVDISTGMIVSFSWLIYPSKINNSDEGNISPLGNASFMAEFFGVLAAHHAKFINSESTYYIYSLATLKEYRGRGLATQLVKPALVKADQAGAKTYLDAFPGAGPSLYRKLGFKEVGATLIDMSKYGGKGKHPIIAMIREPQPQDL